MVFDYRDRAGLLKDSPGLELEECRFAPFNALSLLASLDMSYTLRPSSVDQQG